MMANNIIDQLVILVTLIFLVSSTLISAVVECSERCGNVTVPYPFGMSSGCFRDRNFRIRCDEEAGRAYLLTSSIEVTKITLEGQVHVLQQVARDCYDQDSVRTTDESLSSLRVTQFIISDTQNRFTAVGCDTYALVRGFRRKERYVTGCMSVCDNFDTAFEGNCSGIGCCQTAIPSGLKNITVTLSSYDNYRNTKNSDFPNCSYAFVVEENAFLFSNKSFRDLYRTEKLPMVLDWTVGGKSCEHAMAMDPDKFACMNNTQCVTYKNHTRGSGYLCKCLPGFYGNPYLPGGCRDIDECEEEPARCSHQCNNTFGGFECLCPKGYHGDGRSKPYEEGCILDQPIRRLHIVELSLGIGISGILILAASSWTYFGLEKRRSHQMREKFFQQNGGVLLKQELSRAQISADTAKIFTADELEKATNGYDESLVIGRGGYGTVYKGFLSDDKTVAIKKSKVVDLGQTEQFINEVVVMSQINHRNVVRLLGCCLETQVPLLVYEFVSNGTLFEYIHGQSKSTAISWETRLRVASETAGALSYLHSGASTPIIHRDVKSNNILLNEHYTAKVSDFGASRLVPIDQMEVSTMVQGTLGYLDPEYLQTSQLTEKSDVYSFGVVLVELLTGKEVLSFDRPEEKRSLAMYFLSSLKEDRLLEIVEREIVDEEGVKEVAQTAARCLRVRGEERPSMKEVAMELEGLRMVEPHPWVHVGVSLEETQLLLEKSLECDNIDHVGLYSNSMDHVLLGLDGGR